MKFRLKRIGVLKSAIMGGIGYALLSLLMIPFFLFFMMFAPMHEAGMPGQWALSGAFVFLLPLIYGIMGFVGTALGAAVFNLIAMMVGGLDIELEREGGEPVPVVQAPTGY
jgi:hypothetical protein